MILKNSIFLTAQKSPTMRTYLAVLLLVIGTCLFAQNLRRDKINQALIHIYNASELEATQTITSLGVLDPAYEFLNALKIRWVNFPLEHNALAFGQMNELLERSYQNTMQKNGGTPDERLFIRTVSKSLKAMYGLETGDIGWSEARDAYKAIKVGEDKLDVYNEFLLTTGIYNYLRDKFPDRFVLSGVVNVLAATVFKMGDTKEGMNQLLQASNSTFYAQNEALLYLGHINLRYESNPVESRKYLDQLITKFPNNYFFKVLKAETYYWEGKIDQVEAMIDEIEQGPNEFYQMVALVFKGMVQEFSTRNGVEAIRLYMQAVEKGSTIKNEESLVYQMLAYKGLERLTRDRESRSYQKIIRSDSPYLSLRENPNWIP